MRDRENTETKLFEQLALRRKEVIEGICRRFFPGSRYLQQTATQEVMEKLWHNRKTQTGIALSTDGEKAWVYRYTMNVVINIYRQQQRSRQHLIPFNPAKHGRSDDDSSAQMQQRLYELIDALPNEDKILMLY